MLSSRAVRGWAWVHKWSSLVCTAFMLLLCITGLPLIFEHEIEHWLADGPAGTTAEAGLPMADMDQVLAAARERAPGREVMYVGDITDDGFWYVNMGAAEPGGEPRTVTVDYYTAQVLEEIDPGNGFMDIMLRLHVDMFAGLPGQLFLGAMAVLLVIAVVSGVVLYAPFMRRLDFGEVRRDRSPRVKWLDLHNLLGIVTVTWVLVVGGTGIIHAWSQLVMGAWRAGQMAEMVAPYAGQPPVSDAGSLQAAVSAAQRELPGMQLGFVAFPNTPFSSPHHFVVFMRGTEPLTSRLLQPVLIDARTLAVTDIRPLPWYMTLLLVSEPLHFGDYGGLPMKILWAVLDVMTIIVLGSGLYLWLARRERQVPGGNARPVPARRREPAA